MAVFSPALSPCPFPPQLLAGSLFVSANSPRFSSRRSTTAQTRTRDEAATFQLNLFLRFPDEYILFLTVNSLPMDHGFLQILVNQKFPGGYFGSKDDDFGWWNNVADVLDSNNFAPSR